MTNKKHAYLIMAHNQPELLIKLLTALDNERNDIYIHIDKKMRDFNKSQCEHSVKRANIIFTKRTNVKWGDYSQINCEIMLLKKAIKNKHSYYHLLSGVDFPLKKQSEIYDFFQKYNGLEFVDEDFTIIDEKVLDRIKYYHFLCNKKGKIAQYIKSQSIRIQNKLHIDRTQEYRNISFQKGRNWFSITHELAELVVEKENWIRKVFRASSCGDEIFLQTIARNSVFKDKICNSVTMPMIADTRHIDWERGTPYVFRDNDYLELKNTKALFARKFDMSLDKEIIDKIYMDLQ